MEDENVRIWLRLHAVSLNYSILSCWAKAGMKGCNDEKL